MKLEGSCHCGAVRFTVESDTPYPFMHCYCSICRKTAGAGGSAVHLGAAAETLRIEGAEHVKTYRPWLDAPQRTQHSEGLRHFCGECGSPLWVSDERWPELVHPHASAIDTPLPTPPERNHILLDFKPDWVEVPATRKHRSFRSYPDESLRDWHERHGLLGEEG